MGGPGAREHMPDKGQQGMQRRSHIRQQGDTGEGKDTDTATVGSHSHTLYTL